MQGRLRMLDMDGNPRKSLEVSPPIVMPRTRTRAYYKAAGMSSSTRYVFHVDTTTRRVLSMRISAGFLCVLSLCVLGFLFLGPRFHIYFRSLSNSLLSLCYLPPACSTP
ncbi:hypothetical protein M405DRAFT_81367 [Rhizopogon salebrosus TDB-379]|nr:hypothetical protein M405DRAFT_81367 [Rhizopogon salebrosus TDB-379]